MATLQELNMKLYRFSPIESREQLFEAIKYTHFACFKLCKQSFKAYLPVAGNIGVFCHYEDEYNFLKNLSEELTDASDNINQKYFRLHNPITIPTDGDVPETTYTHLYIRKPDPYRAQVGDVDFITDEDKYIELKNSLLHGKIIKGARIFERADLDMIELYDFDVDALGYVCPQEMAEKVRVKLSEETKL